MTEARREDVASNPDPADRLSDDAVEESARLHVNDDWWADYNLPFLEDAFARGDRVRYVSDPDAADRTFELEVDAVEDPGGLAERYGYVFDTDSQSWMPEN